MKAAQIQEYGDPSVVKVVDIDEPAVDEGKVLVEVHASSLNPFDSAVRAGHVAQMMPPLPVTLGGDLAGVVIEVGEGVSDVVVGDKVYGQAQAMSGNSGAFAEFAATAVKQIAKMPQNLDFQQAASLPLVGVSALQGLVDHIKLAEGQKILITGGAGGIGTIAIQIAKHLGAYVATTASGDGLALVKQLGADEVIDYTADAFEAILTDYDAALDTVGGDEFDKALRVLERGGIAVSMIAPPNSALAEELGVTALGQHTKVTPAALDALRELVEAKIVTPQIGKVFPLDEITAAFEAREQAHVKGKIVIAIQ